MPQLNKKKLRKILQFIKTQRESKGYSQEYVAYKIGITQSAYQKLESGRLSLKVIHVLHLSDLLEFTFSALEDYLKADPDINTALSPS